MNGRIRAQEVWDLARDWNIERARLRYERESTAKLVVKTLGAAGCMAFCTLGSMWAAVATLSEIDGITPNSLPGATITILELAAAGVGSGLTVGSFDRSIQAGEIVMDAFHAPESPTL